MAPSEETNKAPKTDLKEIDIYELSDKEFQIILLKDVQQSTRTQLNKIRKIMHEQNIMWRTQN